MTNVGCVAKLLGNFQMNSSYWLKKVNPNWYEARQVPITLLSEKSTEKHLSRRAEARCKNLSDAPISRKIIRL
ncbi:uncharacterized protein LOC117785641 [Drosophila innubila]|uniref:uncharacterized protein LOC117785641 n=1 Tax=Drosophila innubila TaxID=198719 RepID=UPI00148E6290|nr:uncharacterized protein LOC117785641 [Drosophila innubila]